MTTIGGSQPTVVIKVQFVGASSGTQQAFLVAEVGPRTLVKLVRTYVHC